MSTAVLVLSSISAAVSAVAVIALFVWAARKDGERDQAVQRETGVRRRTRMGR